MFFIHIFTSCFLKDTVDDAASLNVAVLGKVELNEFAKAAGVIVVHGLCIPKCFHDGTADRKTTTTKCY